MRRSSVAVLAVTAALVGCGGGDRDDSAAPATTSTPGKSTTATVAPPTLGCDVVVVCVPEVAHDMLARCPERRLSPEGRHARKRLERGLHEIESVDLHNKQADEASAGAVLALDQLERACTRGPRPLPR